MKIVLEYHMVDYVSHDHTNINIYPDNFEQQIRCLKENFQLLSYDELVWGPDNGGVQLAITFDDVFVGFRDYVYPLLMKYKVPVMLFLTAQYSVDPQEFWMNELARLLLDGKRYQSQFLFRHPMYEYAFPATNYQERTELYHSLKFILGSLNQHEREQCMRQVKDWSGTQSNPQKEYMPLDIGYYRKIKENPLISFGVHTVSHGMLGEMTYEEQVEEIVQSKVFLENALQRRMRHFAYPFGSYNRMTKEILKEQHFRSACSSRRGCIQGTESEILELPRLVPPNVGKAEFLKWMKGLCSEGDVEGADAFIVYAGVLKNDEMIHNGKKKCVIFGAGMFGEILYNKMQNLGMCARLVGFVDNDTSKQGEIFLGYPILPADSLKKEAYEVYVWHYSRSILKQLKEMGVNRVHIITGV